MLTWKFILTSAHDIFLTTSVSALGSVFFFHFFTVPYKNNDIYHNAKQIEVTELTLNF